MGGFMEYNGNEPVRTLLPDQLAGYSLTGTGDFPRIAIEDIKDKSKGDIISKGLVVLQTGWFVVQCIARASQGLPITELELVTIAFASLNFAMYGLWWDKPLNVQRAVRVYKKQDTDKPSMEGSIAMKEGGLWLPVRRSLSALRSAIADAWRDDPWEVVLSPFHMLFTMSGASNDGDYQVRADGKRIGTFYPPSPSINSKSGRIILIATPAIAMVFGAIHCIAWPFEFPSEPERILWRVSSVIITSAPIFLALSVVLIGFDLHLTASLSLEPLGLGLILLCGYVYPIGRICLLVLPFLSLRALPAQAYSSVHWTTLIPHI
jgi:hypothetical protein